LKSAHFARQSLQWQPLKIGRAFVLPSRILASLTYRFAFAVLIPAWILFSVNACTVKARTIEPGTIPKIDALAPGEAKFGEKLFEDLCDDYRLESNPKRNDHLVTTFDHLIQAAAADHLPWHFYLFDDPNTVDVRAVHGNYVFVWSGFLDVTENEDEIAALMACEIAHVLARHTYPVQFTLWSDIFFDVTEMAASLAIMQATQGVVMIGGQGWMKWAYIELADLDSLDREYSAEEEREAAMIAMLIMDRAGYSPEAMLTFWQRVQQDEALLKRVKRLQRELSPSKRVQIIEELLPELPPKAEPYTLEPDKMQTSHRNFNYSRRNIR
jgi:predicted Zn-dependent protease